MKKSLKFHLDCYRELLEKQDIPFVTAIVYKRAGTRRKGHCVFLLGRVSVVFCLCAGAVVLPGQRDSGLGGVRLNAQSEYKIHQSCSSKSPEGQIKTPSDAIHSLSKTFALT